MESGDSFKRSNRIWYLREKKSGWFQDSSLLLSFMVDFSLDVISPNKSFLTPSSKTWLNVFC